MARKVDILLGAVVGRLTVRHQVESDSKKSKRYYCTCSCGKDTLALGYNLRSGNTTSCGCVRKEQLAERNRVRLTKEPWLADMDLYKRKLGYRKLRKGRGSNQFQTLPAAKEVHPGDALGWDLSLDAYKKLVTGDCFYCGQPPHQKPQGVITLAFGLKRNGIDRVDNEKGYTEDNTVSCCTSCNREKRGQSQEVFLSNTERRYLHLVSRGYFTK